MTDLQYPDVNNTQNLLDHIKSRFKRRTSSDSFRVFHGRGRCFPGWDWLNIDAFPQILLLTAYRHEEEQLNALLEQLTHASLSLFLQEFDLKCVLIQRRYVVGAPVESLVGALPESAFAFRKKLKFDMSFGQQNAGFFLDIEPVRAWLEQVVLGKSVLNMFAYTCAFSVVAAAGGASSVVNIDMSKKSISRGRENHKNNNLQLDKITFLAHDVFKSWGKLKKYGPYDIVIIDPPSFQKGSFIAQKDYVRVLRKMTHLVADNGQFVACLNAPEVHRDEFRSWIEQNCPDFTFSRALLSHHDFPEYEAGRELKMLIYTKVTKA